MLILTIKTDQAQSELALFEDLNLVGEITWQAHRTLADTIHLKIKELLTNNQQVLPNINGIVGFKGPGSFTGLRIGLSVANALAYSVGAAIVTASGEDWQKNGISKLLSGQNEKVATPEYGGEANISQPKK